MKLYNCHLLPEANFAKKRYETNNYPHVVSVSKNDG